MSTSFGYYPLRPFLQTFPFRDSFLKKSLFEGMSKNTNIKKEMFHSLIFNEVPTSTFSFESCWT